MRDLSKYLNEKDIRKRVGMYLTDAALQEAMRQGRMLSNNELARIWGERGGRSLSAMSLGAWINGDRVPEGDNRRVMVNALGLEFYTILGEEYFEATDELAEVVEKEGDYLTPQDQAEIREVIERSRRRRGFYTNGLTIENGTA